MLFRRAATLTQIASVLPASRCAFSQKLPVLADDSIMDARLHGTCEQPVQDDLRWGCDNNTADRICCFNRHFAEYSGYAFTPRVTWTKEIQSHSEKEPMKFFDSVTGKLLFEAPKSRTVADFVKESEAHGWPSFRD